MHVEDDKEVKDEDSGGTLKILLHVFCYMDIFLIGECLRVSGLGFSVHIPSQCLKPQSFKISLCKAINHMLLYIYSCTLCPVPSLTLDLQTVLY